MVSNKGNNKFIEACRKGSLKKIKENIGRAGSIDDPVLIEGMTACIMNGDIKAIKFLINVLPNNSKIKNVNHIIALIIVYGNKELFEYITMKFKGQFSLFTVHDLVAFTYVNGRDSADFIDIFESFIKRYHKRDIFDIYDNSNINKNSVHRLFCSNRFTYDLFKILQKSSKVVTSNMVIMLQVNRIPESDIVKIIGKYDFNDYTQNISFIHSYLAYIINDPNMPENVLLLGIFREHVASGSLDIARAMIDKLSYLKGYIQHDDLLREIEEPRRNKFLMSYGFWRYGLNAYDYINEIDRDHYNKWYAEFGRKTRDKVFEKIFRYRESRVLRMRSMILSNELSDINIMISKK